MKFTAAIERRRSAFTLDITALIDVVFLLLIFLLVTTTFREDEHAFTVELPTSSVRQITVTTDKTTVFVAHDGALHLLTVPADAPPDSGNKAKARPITRDELDAALAEIHRRKPEAPISVRGEKNTPYQSIIDVVGVVQEAGFRRILFPYRAEDAEAGAPAPSPSPAAAPAP